MILKSRRALLEYMAFHKLSGRALAKKAGVSPAIVGHLARDPKAPTSRRTCSIKTRSRHRGGTGVPRSSSSPECQM